MISLDVLVEHIKSLSMESTIESSFITPMLAIKVIDFVHLLKYDALYDFPGNSYCELSLSYLSL